MNTEFSNENFKIIEEKILQNKYGEAVEICKSLIEKETDITTLSDVYNKLGDIYYTTKDNNSSISAYEKAVEYGKNSSFIYNRLGYLYFYKDIDKSSFYYLKGMEINPDLKNFVMLTQVMIKSKKYSQKYMKQIFEKYVDIFRPTILNGVTPYTYNKKSFDKNKKLKIGYLSSDFHCHAMMSFILPIIENHNYEEFEINLYSCGKKSDIVTERLKKTGAEYKDCSALSNQELAELIHNDNIDILIDISGYTHNAIWSLLYKPAPVIIQYLGFLGTYGIKEVDYILADKFTIPRNIAKFYTEKPLYIDGGMCKFMFQIENKYLPEITPLPYEKNGYITLGSFNSLLKINPYTIQLWSEVLKNIPDSKLLIYRTQMEQRDIERFALEFTKNGIDISRIIFDKEPMQKTHMESYLKCDFALDPTPFSGLTITIENAFMGVPVLTMAGETISSKGTARINRTIGLNNFIAKNEKDYVKKAVKIASDIKKLKYYRKNLRNIIKNSYLCNDYKIFTQKIEKEYKKAWKNFCR